MQCLTWVCVPCTNAKSLLISHFHPILPLSTFTKAQGPMEEHMVDVPLRPQPSAMIKHRWCSKPNYFFLTVNEVKDDNVWMNENMKWCEVGEGNCWWDEIEETDVPEKTSKNTDIAYYNCPPNDTEDMFTIRDTRTELCWILNFPYCCLFQMPTHCTITRFGFRARRTDGVECGLFFSNHAPLGQATLRVGRVSV